jgi:uncharacterized protein (TIGR02145 family)
MKVSTSVSSALGSIATKILLFAVFIVSSFSIFAQVGIGTATPATSAKLDVSSTTQGFLPPRMTTAERNAIATPAAGLMIINTTSGCINIYSGTIWRELCPTAAPGTISSLAIGSAVNNGTLTSGVAASSVSSVVPYTGGNGEPHSGQTVTSTGVTGLTATLSAGMFAVGAGTLTYTITGTPASSGTASFALNIGGAIGTLTRAVANGTIASINCAGATNSGTLTASVTASSVSSVVPYTGGNGGPHSGQTVTSTGVTGLTATLSAGSFASGAGTLTYTITGTPATGGTASFNISIGGQACTLTRTVSSPYPAGAVFCTANPTAIVDLTSPSGRIWMDRNLGATQVAGTLTDVNSYGDLYQWGRSSDGHQCRTSTTTYTQSNIDVPTHGQFILMVSGSTFADWRNPQNQNLWQGTSGGINNPCPTGYRVPTEVEWNAEKTSWGATASNQLAAAFATLKLPAAGSRHFDYNVTPGIQSVGTGAFYWTSDIANTSYAGYFVISSTISYINKPVNRSWGMSVRCIKKLVTD